mmetsp:Transcript_11209/g.34316  ORF Transcript_11209/g.34316 Transcript_11209/m.34316 type:complete len:292 (-) Transcript_11209:941-1816(-)
MCYLAALLVCSRLYRRLPTTLLPFSVSTYFLLRLPNWSARFSLVHDSSDSSRFLAIFLKIILSPTPSSKVRSAISRVGISATHATTSSSRKGNLTSRPWSLMTRSSRPRLRHHNLAISASSSAFSASSPPLANTVRCRPLYPASCSSAPRPLRRTLAGVSYISSSYSADLQSRGLRRVRCPLPRAANQSAVAMDLSIGVLAGAWSEVIWDRCRSISSGVTFTDTSCQLRRGKRLLSSVRLMSAVSRSGLANWGDNPKDTLIKSIVQKEGSRRLVKQATTIESIPPEKSTAT